VHPDMLPRVPEGTVPIVTTEPYQAVDEIGLS
jgi:hypothetical protein